MADNLKQFEFEIEENDIDKLLECEELIVGGTSFIKRSLFVEALAKYAAKKVAQVMAKKQLDSTEH